MNDARRSSASALRNRDPIAEVLAEWLPERGTVLEVASGSGEHVIHFAARFPHLMWQPSDVDAAALASVAAWRDEAGLSNVLAPVRLDVTDPVWRVGEAAALLSCNMIHISPWEATLGLMAGAGRLLGTGGALILYGPYLEPEVATADSNLAFDADLKRRNPAWGLRPRDAVVAAAEAVGLTLTDRRAMPANNIMLRLVRGASEGSSAGPA